MGQLHNFVIGLIVILAILILNGYGKGMVSAAAVLGGTPSSPIDERRTRDNFSVLANTSNSWRVGKSKD